MGPHFFSNRKIYTSHNDRDVKNKIKIKGEVKMKKRFIMVGLVVMAIIGTIMMNSYKNDLEDMVIELEYDIIESDKEIDTYEEGYVSNEYLEELEYNSRSNKWD